MSDLRLSLHAENVPRHVRAHLFASHLATRRSFDRRASLGGYASHATGPLVDELRRTTEFERNRGLSAVTLRDVLFEVHSLIIAGRLIIASGPLVARFKRAA